MSNLAKQRVRWLITKVPVYGQLINSSRSSIFSAFSELVVATIFSLLPIWLYPLIVWIGYGENFDDTALSFISSGELFLFSSALVGPLIYSITKNYGEDEETEAGKASGFPLIKSIQFPYGFWFVIISVFTCLFAAAFFGIFRANDIIRAIIAIDQETLFETSLFMYLFTLSCFFCVSVYRINLENVPKSFGNDTRGLMDEWGERNE